MASQLRLRVLLPVAVLGVLGLGVGAFATTRSTPKDPGAITPPAQTTTKTPKPNKSNKPRARAPLEAALRKHSVVVVLFYAPGDGYDTIQTRETRAGAVDVGAGFLAIDVTKNRSVAALAAKYEVRDAPATVVFKRGPKVVYRIAGYIDRMAIAQAAADARG